MSRGGDIVREGQSVVAPSEMHVEQALIGTVEGNTPVCHGHHRVKVAHVGRQDHDACVEEVRPADIGGSREGVRQVEELIGGAVGDDIGIEVDNLGELHLLPEVDLGEGRVQVGAVHEVQIGGLLVAYPRHGQDIIVNRLWEARA